MTDSALPATHLRDRSAYARDMEEPRAVVERLERIESLRRDGRAGPPLLDELRALLAEGEAWLAAEREGRGAVDGRERSPRGDAAPRAA